MKKLIIVFIVILVLFLFLGVACYKLDIGSIDMTKEELIRTFHDEKDRYIKIAESIKKYDHVILFETDVDGGASTKFDYQLTDKIYCHSAKSLTNEQVKEFNIKNIEYLLIKLELDNISVTDTCITFFEGSNFEDGHGIIYLKTEDLPNWDDSYTYEKIEGDFYYYAHE